jgi:hypothetical protein
MRTVTINTLGILKWKERQSTDKQTHINKTNPQTVAYITAFTCI